MADKTPRVGIFMPAYNQGQYIDEAIESLKAQTFQDFEVAVVDDASTDSVTIPILKKLHYDKATVYLNKSNQGVGNRARTYFEKLTNEYILVLCADDKLQPKFIEECVAYLDKHPDYGAVGTWIQEFGESSDVREIKQRDATFPKMLIENHFLGSSMMRREALVQIGFGNKAKVFQKHNDYDRWVSILENDWKLGVIEKPLFYYRILSTSLSRSINVAEEVAFRKAFIDKHKGLFEQHVQYLILHYYEASLVNWQWQKELAEGRDWLDIEYNKLKAEKENSKTLKAYSFVRTFLRPPRGFKKR